ncbi:MAG: hypothetical protein QOH95_2060 [Gaiellaceae bacterium]|nr:hypothetical protein [Gaiellaceae bacterium]
MRRLAAALAVLALVATGCGSKSTSSGLDTALSYVPKDAGVVIAIDTNPDGGQWQQVDHLLGKFPFGGQVKQQAKAAFNARANLDYDKDIKPLLGNEMVYAMGQPTGQETATPFVFAWKLKDETAARRLLQATTEKSPVTIQGLDVYGRPPTNFAVIKDGTLVVADTFDALGAALKRPSGDHMTESEFDSGLGDLKKDSLVRATGDFQRLFRNPGAVAARKIKWVGALKSFAFTLRADSDGIEYAFKFDTDSGGLASNDLPLASGPQSPPVVKRAGEIGFGIRNPVQIVSFAQQAASITNPKGYGKYLRDKTRLSKQLGVDVDRDLIGQLTGNASLSASVNGELAARADLRDPAAAAATLKKVAPRLVRIAKRRGKTVTLSTAGNIYTLSQPNGKKLVFGVIGKSFVVASDAARAAQFAGESPSSVSNAKGSMVVFSDARALANAIAAKRGQGVAAQIVTSALGDLTGSVQTETDGITGSVKLQIK